MCSQTKIPNYTARRVLLDLVPATSTAESRYYSFELETLAIIYALRSFRTYLEGIPLNIVTDCKSLAMSLEKGNINARIARWALELENFNYKIVHRRGISMGHVETLSRVQIAPFDINEVEFSVQVPQEPSYR